MVNNSLVTAHFAVGSAKLTQSCVISKYFPKIIDFSVLLRPLSSSADDGEGARR